MGDEVAGMTPLAAKVGGVQVELAASENDGTIKLLRRPTRPPATAT